MSQFLRGELDQVVEQNIIKELSGIYIKMTDRFSQMIEQGSDVPLQEMLLKYPAEQRLYYALLDLLCRMELDFTQKFALNVKHDLPKEVEIGKIQIAFLDRMRRLLNGALN